MGDHQSLHGHGVFLHQISDAGVGIDDYFIGQTHLAALVIPLGRNEFLAIAPMPVIDRHANRGIGIHHLFGGDDFQLVGEGIETKALGRLTDHVVILVEQVESPVAWRGQGFGRARSQRLHLSERRPHSAATIFRPGRAEADFPAVFYVCHGPAPSFLNKSRKTG